MENVVNMEKAGPSGCTAVGWIESGSWSMENVLSMERNVAVGT